MSVIVIGVATSLLVSCAPPSAGNLHSARQACNGQFPPKTGNLTLHAQCVNDAIERFAVPTARHPDLVRLQEKIRLTLSEKIDRRQISRRTGEHRMATADRLISQAEHARDRGDVARAERRVRAASAILRK